MGRQVVLCVNYSIFLDVPTLFLHSFRCIVFFSSEMFFLAMKSFHNISLTPCHFLKRKSSHYCQCVVCESVIRRCMIVCLIFFCIFPLILPNYGLQLLSKTKQ